MDDKQVRQLLISILAEAVCPSRSAATANDIGPETLISVYQLAKKHDLSHVVAAYVHENKIEVSPELGAALKQDAFLSVYRCERLKYTLKEICDALEAATIPHIPLKGSEIRPYYPQESMRTSCDIDILIHEEDLDAAIQALESKGYRCGERHYHDVSLYSPGQVHLELHFNILENNVSLDTVLQDAWQYAECVQGSRYAFRKEFFVFHMYAHMAYHFLAGGCGLRSLMDIWVMEHNMDAPYSCAEDLLKKAGIYQFAAEMSRITDSCFAGQAKDVLADQVLQYIFCGGVYGTKGNAVGIYRSQNSGMAKYWLERIFLPYRSMVIAYPVLKKAPWLLPVYWVVRWFKALFGGKTGRLAAEIASANNVSAEQIAQTKDICSRLGL